VPQLRHVTQQLRGKRVNRRQQEGRTAKFARLTALIPGERRSVTTEPRAIFTVFKIALGA
jgi:hypothetical protein